MRRLVRRWTKSTCGQPAVHVFSDGAGFIGEDKWNSPRLKQTPADYADCADSDDLSMFRVTTRAIGLIPKGDWATVWPMQ